MQYVFQTVIFNKKYLFHGIRYMKLATDSMEYFLYIYYIEVENAFMSYRSKIIVYLVRPPHHIL